MKNKDYSEILRDLHWHWRTGLAISPFLVSSPCNSTSSFENRHRLAKNVEQFSHKYSKSLLENLSSKYDKEFQHLNKFNTEYLWLKSELFHKNAFSLPISTYTYILVPWSIRKRRTDCSLSCWSMGYNVEKSSFYTISEGKATRWKTL